MAEKGILLLKCFSELWLQFREELSHWGAWVEGGWIWLWSACHYQDLSPSVLPCSLCLTLFPSALCLTHPDVVVLQREPYSKLHLCLNVIWSSPTATWGFCHEQWHKFTWLFMHTHTHTCKSTCCHVHTHANVYMHSQPVSHHRCTPFKTGSTPPPPSLSSFSTIDLTITV